MKITMTKIWAAAALLALIGLAQAQSGGNSDTEVSSQLMNANPYLAASHK